MLFKAFGWIVLCRIWQVDSMSSYASSSRLGKINCVSSDSLQAKNKWNFLLWQKNSRGCSFHEEVVRLFAIERVVRYWCCCWCGGSWRNCKVIRVHEIIWITLNELKVAGNWRQGVLRTQIDFYSYLFIKLLNFVHLTIKSEKTVSNITEHL